ncbi:MAG: hypothetical protein P8103_07910 [Candidatus Thiodiazotropha sp.]
MDPHPSWRQRDHLIRSINKTWAMLLEVLPLILGVILLTGLLLKLLPIKAAAGWFGSNDMLDAVIGALAGSISAGHPATSYVLGGELLSNGVSLVAVTAFLISWVTVGSIQLPAEALMLSWRFALLRNLVCFLFSIVIALLTVFTLAIID